MAGDTDIQVGLIARADNRGLGTQTWELFRHLKPAKTMVVDIPSVQPLPMRFDRFRDAVIVQGWPGTDNMRRFAQDLDVVFTCEIPYHRSIYDFVPTVLQYNYEFLDIHGEKPALFAAPSSWHYDDVPWDNKTLLQVPIATERFTMTWHPPVARRFLHIVGRPAIHDRNGTIDLLQALHYVKSTIRVTIRCQQHNFVKNMLREYHISVPPNVLLLLDERDRENYWENYADQDVLVMPRRFGGLCLPAQEAIGAGMPVIMPDISPNNDWLPVEWLTPATKHHQFMARNQIDVYRTDPRVLAAKMDQFATDGEFYRATAHTAGLLAHELSWKSLLPAYRKVLESCASSSVS